MSSRLAVLHRNVESVRIVFGLDHLPDILYREEEVRNLGDGEVFQPLDYALWADEDMAGDERLQVYDCEGVLGAVEYLGVR